MFFQRGFVGEKVFLPALNAGVVFGIRGIVADEDSGEQSCTSLLARGGHQIRCGWRWLVTRKGRKSSAIVFQPGKSKLGEVARKSWPTMAMVRVGIN